VVNAARGTLCHWICIREGKIGNYQIITPNYLEWITVRLRRSPGPLGGKLRWASPFPTWRVHYSLATSFVHTTRVWFAQHT
jgi:hypothetical protein